MTDQMEIGEGKHGLVAHHDRQRISHGLSVLQRRPVRLNGSAEDQQFPNDLHHLSYAGVQIFGMDGDRHASPPSIVSMTEELTRVKVLNA